MDAVMKSITGLALILLLLVSGADVAQAEFKIYPSLAISEIYDDNFFNAETDEVSEFITRFMPAIALDYQQARIDANLAYTLDYRFYAQGERGNEAVHFLDFLTLLNANDRYFFEIADRLSQVSLSRSRDFGEESLFANQSDQNIFSLSPYVQLATSKRGTFKGGYQFVMTTYLDDEGVDKFGHTLFAEQSFELTSHINARGGYRYLNADTDELDYDKQDIWGGLRFEFDEDSYLSANVGYTWIDFVEEDKQNDLFWDLALTRDFNVLVATLGAGISYVEDPEGTVLREEGCRLALSRDWTRSRLSASVSWSDFYDADIDLRDTRRYGGTGSFQHEITSRLSGTLVFSGFKYEEETDDTWTRRLIGSAALAYLLADDFTSTLTLYRIDSHSPELPDDRFETNRIFFELKKVF